MKVAILHDYLNQFGGAERVLQAILEIFPDADLYALLYDKNRTYGFFEQNIRKTSFLNYPWIKKKHRLFIPFMPIGAKFLKSKEKYDLVISSSAGYGKAININAPYHISYCHSPLRYAWEIDYLKDLPFTPWPLKEAIVKPIANWLKTWDRRASSKINIFVANSEYIAGKIKNYYGREAIVIYPPVDLDLFYPELTTNAERDYYLMAGRLLYYKGFDLGIEAFNRLKRPLKIVGRGPEMKKLISLVKTPYIQFIPFVSDDDLRLLYSNARGFIFPQIEDFGLVAAEAQACSLPVIAYNQGGGSEIVVNKVTGLHFNEQTPQAIVQAVYEFENLKFDRRKIRQNAERFSKEGFKRKFKELIRNAGFV
ncbi:MAG: glycosyltransferase [Patescibacteria group bacterium]|nr:glycosyltransferase [Patescibacteria group bacterium]